MLKQFPPDCDEPRTKRCDFAKLGTSVLQFWTSSAILPLYDDFKDQCPCGNLHHPASKIKDPKAGSFPKILWFPCENINLDNPQVKAIVVSQEVVQVDITDDPCASEQTRRRTARPSKTIYEQRLFTLCITWVDGVAQRIGRPENGIAEDDWMSLNPTWKFIELG